MAGEKFNILKLFSGFNIFSGEKLGKLIFQVIIVILCLWLFWAKFIYQPKTSQTSQKATTMTNITMNQTESAFELQLLPPKVQIGGFKFKLFGIK